LVECHFDRLALCAGGSLFRAAPGVRALM